MRDGFILPSILLPDGVVVVLLEAKVAEVVLVAVA
jgi:hypothetical protein